LPPDSRWSCKFAPTPRQIGHDADAERSKLSRRADAGAHQNDRRTDGAARKDDVQVRLDRLTTAVLDNVDTPASIAGDRKSVDKATGAEVEIRPGERRREIGVGDALTPSLDDGQRVEGRSRQTWTVVLIGRREAVGLAGRHIGECQRMGIAGRHQGDWTGVAVKGGARAIGSFRADEIGHQVGITPAVAARRNPAFEVVGVAAHMGHGVERGGTTDDLAPRPIVDPVRGMALRHRTIGPVDGAALQQGPLRRLGDARIGGGTTGLDQANLEMGILAEAGGQNRSRGARTNHQEIEPIIRT
jgi:hypothetical protein